MMKTNNHMKVTSVKNNKGSSDTFYLGFIFVLIVGGGYYIYDDMQKNAQAPVVNTVAPAEVKQQESKPAVPAPVVESAVVESQQTTIAKQEPVQTESAPAAVVAEPAPKEAPVEETAKSETPAVTEEVAAKVEETTEVKAEAQAVKAEVVEEKPAAEQAPAEVVVESKPQQVVAEPTKEAPEAVAAPVEAVVETEPQTAPIASEPVAKEPQQQTAMNRHPMYDQPGFIPPPRGFMPPRPRMMYMPEQPDFSNDPYAPEGYMARMHNRYMSRSTDNYMPRPYYRNNRYYPAERPNRPQQPRYGY